MLYNSGHQGHSVFPAPGKALLPLLLVLALAACRDSEPDDKPARRPVSLAFSISNSRNATRMSTDITQENGNLRTLGQQYLYPYNSQEEASLVQLDVQLEPIEHTQNYINESANILDGTDHFLCYCTVKKKTEGDAVNGCTSNTGLVGTTSKNSISFSPKVITSDEVTAITLDAEKSNTADRFVYPAELIYYADSPIRTSQDSQKDHYSGLWLNVLSYYDLSNKMEGGVQSVAIEEPLNYAVGCLKIGLVVQSPLTDKADNTFPLSSTTPTFPLTAVFATGQFEQNYDFTPKDTGDEYIVCDKSISNISMGAQAASTGNSDGTPLSYTSTLVLQSKVGQNVRFALEFTNNSESAIETLNGTVSAGNRFYLVGTIKPESSNEAKRQVFTKDHYTQGVVTIKSLKNAYPYLPDLFNPNLEVDLELVTTWTQSTTTNVPL